MTARLPREPMRVTSRLADSADYMFATVLVAGRWLCAPLRRGEGRATLQPAYASAGPVALNTARLSGPQWNTQAPPPLTQSGRLVRAAEIVMLSIAFFLAAHLLSGGTSTAVAPNMNPLGLLPEQARAESLPVANARHEVTVHAGQFAPPIAVTQAPAASVAVEPLPTQEAAVLAPAPAAQADAASVPASAPEPAPAAIATPAPAVQQAPPPPPVPPAPPEATAPSAAAVPVGRIYTEDEVRSAALAAGWPPELLDQVVKVAWCESRFNSGAEYLGARGLMQMIVGYWFEPFGLDPRMWADPVTNLTAARHAYDQNKRWSGDGWAAWTCKP